MLTRLYGQCVGHRESHQTSAVSIRCRVALKREHAGLRQTEQTAFNTDISHLHLNAWQDTAFSSKVEPMINAINRGRVGGRLVVLTLSITAAGVGGVGNI